MTDALTGEIHKTWFFVMALAWSRHQYVEFVRGKATELA
jgi:transposase